MSTPGAGFLNWLGLNQTGPAVRLTTLPAPYFKIPPSPDPTTVPPPPDHPTLAHPITIPASVYNGLLSAQVPITIALVYMSVVAWLNTVNARRAHAPWAVSKTSVFKLVVILHNILLAVYSAWTCVGMINALHLSLPPWSERPGGLAQTLDVLCKMHGPRGYGSAATFNATKNVWTMTNRLFHLAADGLGPESADVGRIWNEGLAFYGWLFYLSKFYEVIDTFIILAKGKKSSFLQTYHHAGAMLCMWAGIRYMSPPIWMFVMVNSGIHAIMYTFYLLSALGIRVPTWFKQSLTTLQITQFVVGASYAFAHLFVAYQIPVSVPYIYHLGTVASQAVSQAPSAVSSAAASAMATASAGLGSWLKKVALRAAGQEGLAENVVNEHGRPFGIDAVHIVEDLVAREETRYRDELVWVTCLDTSGQVFAILLNCMYLAPLTWLFLQFFVTSYLRRVERRRSSGAGETAVLARKSLHDASKGVRRRLSEAVEEMHRTAEAIGDDDAVLSGAGVADELKTAVKRTTQAVARGADNVDLTKLQIDPAKVTQELQRDVERVRQNMQSAADSVRGAVAGGDGAGNARQGDTDGTTPAATGETERGVAPNGNGTGAAGETGPPSS